MAKLTFRQEQFIDYYIQTGNATEAAKMAGYKQPNVQGTQNLVKLSSCIKERQSLLSDKRIADMQEINEFWTDIMRNKDADVKDRIKASELRAKVQGAFVDKLDIKGELNNDISVNIKVVE